MEDFVYLDEISHFDRERIPERVVHAKGAGNFIIVCLTLQSLPQFIANYIYVIVFHTGAFGYFEVTHDITKYSRAKIFSQIGKRTPVAVRFSTVGGESGSADTVRYIIL